MCYLDDILVTGKNDEEHLANLKATLDRLKQHGLRAKRSKCVFMADSVEYLGYRGDRTGLHVTEMKQAAIQQAPRTKDVKQFRAFLGLVNYYGKFIPQLSTIEKLLNDLLKKEVKWQWTDQCELAFVILQRKLASADVLVHYDPKLPLRLACDASAYGLGAVLSHVMPDGKERPIAYASKSLSQREVKYAKWKKRPTLSSLVCHSFTSIFTAGSLPSLGIIDL